MWQLLPELDSQLGTIVMLPSIFRTVGLALAVGVLSGPGAAQLVPHRVFTGEKPGDKLGEALAAVPDVNGDGRPEILIGVFRADKPVGTTTIADAGAAYLIDGASLRRIRTFYGEKTDARLGYAVAGVPDVDGDGSGDLLLGSPRYWGVGSWSGRVYVFSGKTGTLLTTLDGDAETAQFGYSVAGLEDLDGDGRGEILVGAYGRNGTAGPDAGRAYLYSGKTGTLLKEWQGEGQDHYFGVCVSGVPDADGDGKMDILIGASEWGVTANERRGRAYLYSGATRALIRTHDGANVGDLFAWAVAGVPDTNGDGRGDLIVGARDFDPPNAHNAGRVYLFSGKDGKLLNTFDGEQAVDNLGRNVAGVPDLNDDGLGDLILPAHRGDGQAGIDTGIVYVRSGADGKLLYRFEGEIQSAYLGWGVAGAPDINGDSRGEILIGSYQYGEPGKIDLGRAYVYTQGLTADRSDISAAAGGTITLTLDAGKKNASRPYLLLAAFQGADPGLALPGSHLPLNYGPVFALSYFLANSPLFEKTFSLLDANGKGQARIHIAPGLVSAWIGGKLTMAYGLVDRFDMASNPAQVAVGP